LESNQDRVRGIRKFSQRDEGLYIGNRINLKWGLSEKKEEHVKNPNIRLKECQSYHEKGSRGVVHLLKGLDETISGRLLLPQTTGLKKTPKIH